MPENKEVLSALTTPPIEPPAALVLSLKLIPAVDQLKAKSEIGILNVDSAATIMLRLARPMAPKVRAELASMGLCF
ncbi:MAG: hypothetical protein WC028_00370 [Candidatus Obscuribacterales bacterium]